VVPKKGGLQWDEKHHADQDFYRQSYEVMMGCRGKGGFFGCLLLFGIIFVFIF
jgi:hypothetical protein